jgi:hypothetical protein
LAFPQHFGHSQFIKLSIFDNGLVPSPLGSKLSVSGNRTGKFSSFSQTIPHSLQ